MALVKQEKKVQVRLRGGYSCKIGQEEHHGGEFGKVVITTETDAKARANLFEPIDAPSAKKKEEKKPDPVEPETKDIDPEKVTDREIKTAPERKTGKTGRRFRQ
jgi:hypothetical protein